MLTFEQLEKHSPKMHYLSPDSSGHLSTTFWEDLYQLFKARYEQETTSKKEAGDD